MSVNRRNKGIGGTVLVVAVLAVLGFAGNWLSVPVAYSVDFLFGSIFTILAVGLFGIFWGAAAALIASSYTYSFNALIAGIVLLYAPLQRSRRPSNGGHPYDLELEMVSARGVAKWVRTIGHPIVEHGRVVAVQGSFQDISDRKRAEDVLRHSLDEKVAPLKEVHHRVQDSILPEVPHWGSSWFRVLPASWADTWKWRPQRGLAPYSVPYFPYPRTTSREENYDSCADSRG